MLSFDHITIARGPRSAARRRRHADHLRRAAACRRRRAQRHGQSRAYLRSFAPRLAPERAASFVTAEARSPGDCERRAGGARRSPGPRSRLCDLRRRRRAARRSTRRCGRGESRRRAGCRGCTISRTPWAVTRRAPAQESSCMVSASRRKSSTSRASRSFGGWRVRPISRPPSCAGPTCCCSTSRPTTSISTLCSGSRTVSPGYAGTLLVISHDREFLDAVTTQTLHLSPQQRRDALYRQLLRSSSCFAPSAARAAGSRARSQQQQIAHLQSSWIASARRRPRRDRRNRRLKMIERIGARASGSRRQRLRVQLRSPDKLPAPLLRLDKVAAGYGERTVWRGARMDIGPGARIGLLGPRRRRQVDAHARARGEFPVLAGEMVTLTRACASATWRSISSSSSTPRRRPFCTCGDRSPRSTSRRARTFLGGFDFRGTRVYEAGRNVSRAARRRGSRLRWSCAHVRNLLLLDEPTNHLDLDMRAPRWSWRSRTTRAPSCSSRSTGTCSESPATRLWRVAEGTVQRFDGDLEDYAACVAARERSWSARG